MCKDRPNAGPWHVSTSPQIMADLADSGLRLHGLHPQQQQQQSEGAVQQQSGILTQGPADSLEYFSAASGGSSSALPS